MIKNKNIVARNVNFADWYTSVIKQAQLILYGPIKGTMFFLPNGWSIWKHIQQFIDNEFAKMGVENIQLPLFIRQSDFMKETEHVKNFAPEIFVVTHNNKTELSEKLIVRPTSEITFCQCFKEILHSYNDLPILYNQWCNVFRVEKNTRPFLRNCEFHWQELHTIHATTNEAINQTKKTLELYKDFVENTLCIPVLSGKKTINERFAGACDTYTIEALMQDGQMLQCATSHYLGQNFSNVYDLKFQTKENKQSFVEQTSAGISTRIIGGLIMSHSDDNGLVLPMKIAPKQIVIACLTLKDKKTQVYVKKIKNLLSKKYRVFIDESDKTLGYKINSNQIQGVPFVLVIGSKELESNTVTLVKRNEETKETISFAKLSKYFDVAAKNFDKSLYNKAKLFLESSIVEVKNIEQFKDALQNKKIILAPLNDTIENEIKIKELTGATPRCIKHKASSTDKCFLTNEPATDIVYFARAY